MARELCVTTTSIAAKKTVAISRDFE